MFSGFFVIIRFDDDVLNQKPLIKKHLIALKITSLIETSNTREWMTIINRDAPDKDHSLPHVLNEKIAVWFINVLFDHIFVGFKRVHCKWYEL